jgi:TolB-like protein
VDGIPLEIEQAVQRALAMEPKDRFDTADQFAAALTGTQAPGAVAEKRGTALAGATPGTRPPTLGLTATDEGTAPTRERTSSRFRLGIAVGALAVAVAFVGRAEIARWASAWLGSQGTVTVDGESAVALSSLDLDPRRIAVLYFDDHSRNQDLAYLANGLTEELIAQLNEVRELEVISRNGVKPYRDTGVTVDSIVRALRPGTIVAGSVIRGRDQIRVHVQVIDAATSAHIGGRRLERAESDVLPLLDDLAHEVSFFLRERLGEEIRIRDLKAGTDSPDAWGLVQRAKLVADDGDLLRAGGDAEGAAQFYGRADSLLAEAEAADADWLAPVLERGWNVARLAKLPAGSPESYDRTAIDSGLAHAERALELAPGDPRVLELRGTLNGWIGRSGDGQAENAALDLAFADLEAALAMNSSLARAWAALCELLVYTGRFDRARVAIARALAADAFLEEAQEIYYWAARVAMDSEEFAEAVFWTNEGYRRFSEKRRFAAIRLILFGSPRLNASLEQAWEAFHLLEQVEPPDKLASHRMKMAAVLAAADLPDSARSVIRWAHEAVTDDPFVLYYEAKARLNLGERDEALRLLERFVEARPGFRLYLAEDWWFWPLFDDPTFQSLVADETTSDG